MGIKRYELSTPQWRFVAPLLPGKFSDADDGAEDTRLFVNGCLWILRSGAYWHHLPERYGQWQTVYRRFNRWCHAGVWKTVFERLVADQDNLYLEFDTAILQAHHQAANATGRRRVRRWGVPNMF
ncbi:transposase [Komagataeibacter nataicola]|uniref:transposase n=1 Tax=Komagataeibacter nataicola TaxID=265960 RepID=UPI0023DD0E3C|nr:transposase [Komagataeibacter nataicola]WEQ56301.1 transposase [Komagataeibacter nataicola]